MVIRIHPEEGITFCVNSKIPGPAMRPVPVALDFSYGTAFGRRTPEAYERLLLDALLGDATLFAREDEVEESWRICTPVLEAWQAHPSNPEEFPNYAAGTWGPSESDELLARDGRAWRSAGPSRVAALQN
jgi:glucose-6-phosphate 1-dehydrogenase